MGRYGHDRPGDTPGWILRRRVRLWEYVDPGPQPGCLYLPGVRTYVYTTERSTSRQGITDHRQARVRQILTAFGFRDWQWYFGRVTPNYYSEIWKGHCEILRREDPPVLILEDDVEPRAFVANVQIPAGAQVACLGGGRIGRTEGIAAGRAAGIPFLRHGMYGYIPIDRDWMRTTGMWFTHALLWLDKAAMLQMCDLWEAAEDMIDNVTAKESWRFFWVTRRVPMFWQNDGHHYRDTYAYDPPVRT